MSQPLGAANSIGPGQPAHAAGVGIAVDIDTGQPCGLLLDLFADLEGHQPLHDTTYLLHPYLAGIIAAGFAQRCHRMGTEAEQQFQLGMAQALAGTAHAIESLNIIRTAEDIQIIHTTQSSEGSHDDRHHLH